MFEPQPQINENASTEQKAPSILAKIKSMFNKKAQSADQPTSSAAGYSPRPQAPRRIQPRSLHTLKMQRTLPSGKVLRADEAMRLFSTYLYFVCCIILLFICLMRLFIRESQMTGLYMNEYFLATFTILSVGLIFASEFEKLESFIDARFEFLNIGWSKALFFLWLTLLYFPERFYCMAFLGAWAALACIIMGLSVFTTGLASIIFIIAAGIRIQQYRDEVQSRKQSK